MKNPSKPSTTRSYAGISPEERVARRRQQFIDAGRQLFGTIGYRKTTVRLLCAEAGLTDRYFYESFPTIEALLVTVYQNLIDELERRMLMALATQAESDFSSRIRDGLDVFFQAAEDPVLARVVWIEILGVSPGADAVYNVALRRFVNIIFIFTKTHVPLLSVSDAVARSMCMGLIGAVSETVKDWVHSGYEQPREVVVEAMSVLFKSMLTYIHAE
ncbi:TetR/AcrR family transcriptional regulator [Agitococcus lubricus]|uniref:TetR family transcriptional regulator n=1 Tax=Agitococcus lubricus TaxID=1077255 RepID=A0A2T5IYG1_9GAMM|nr:TetR/AcrR family transcriptional regulator [Agitococcus lubricus]PTQ89039.1 TetR family transcriptional regulator [Agitococcus lubricus]